MVAASPQTALANLLRSLFPDGADCRPEVEDATQEAGDGEFSSLIDWSGSWAVVSRELAGALLRRGMALPFLESLRAGSRARRTSAIDRAMLLLRAEGAVQAEALSVEERQKFEELVPERGSQVGPWQLTRLCADRSRAQLWEATGPHGEVVAVKLLKAEWALDPEEVRAFTLGASRAEKVVHPGSVRIVHPVSYAGPPWFFAMEFVQGRSLQDALVAVQPHDRVRWALHIVDQVCDVLHWAHSRGVVHQGVWPANLMVVGDDSRPRVVLIDYGVLRMDQVEGRLEARRFRAPEVSVGHTADDGRIDVFGVAATLCQLLSPHGHSLGAEPRTEVEALLVSRELRVLLHRALDPMLENRPALAEFHLGVRAHLESSDLELGFDGPWMQRGGRSMELVRWFLRRSSWGLAAMVLATGLIMLPFHRLAEGVSGVGWYPALLVVGFAPLLVAAVATAARRVQHVARDWTLRGLLVDRGGRGAIRIWHDHRNGLWLSIICGLTAVGWILWHGRDDWLWEPSPLALAIQVAMQALLGSGVAASVLAVGVAMTLGRLVGRVRVSRVRRIDRDLGRFIAEFEIAARWPRLALALSVGFWWVISLQLPVSPPGFHNEASRQLGLALQFVLGAMSLGLWLVPSSLILDQGAWHPDLLRAGWLASGLLLLAIPTATLWQPAAGAALWPVWLIVRAAAPLRRQRLMAARIQRSDAARRRRERRSQPAEPSVPRLPMSLALWDELLRDLFSLTELQAFTCDQVPALEDEIDWTQAARPVRQAVLEGWSKSGLLQRADLVDRLCDAVPGRAEEIRQRVAQLSPAVAPPPTAASPGRPPAPASHAP